HAWVEVHLPCLGWLGFDPTNSITAGERHIRVAIGRDYADVPPTRGVFRGDVETELDVGVQVSRLDEQTAENPTMLASMIWDPPPDESYDPYAQQQQ
ncbi:MAG: transglutaminase family protein, partial [Candidatus Promineifilaceae bacterium]